MLKQKILDELKAAMKAGDTLKRDALRMVDSMIKNDEIQKGKREKGLSDEEIQGVLARAIKQRRDAAEQYTRGGRTELANKEKKEIEILTVYLPVQMSEEEVRQEIKVIVEGLGAKSKQQLGQVMGIAMEKLKGKADGNLVKDLALEELEKASN